MDAQQPTSSPDRDLRRSAHANGLAGLGLTLGLGLGLAGVLGLDMTYVPKALAA